MRIISGKYRGKNLKTFKGQEIRPTSDRAKEALFNILSFQVVSSTFLDAFSGTGAVGIEAISRGAKEVIFTDISKDSVNICKSNLESIKEDAKVYLQSADSYLSNTTKKFDIIFLDPPYAYDKIDKLFEIIGNRNLLNEGGQVIYEHKSDRESQRFYGFNLVDTRRYGIAIFDFYKVDKVWE